MNRKEFLKTCGFACLGSTALGILLQGCAGSKMITAEIIGENMIVPISNFEILKDDTKSFRKYLVVQNPKLQYPIYLYRFSDIEYLALYMRCSHQGAELTAYGDKLVCSAHGSEFDTKGNATSAPADKPLKTFPVTMDNQNLKISLRA
jgi:Rieske Fe-S protein